MTGLSGPPKPGFTQLLLGGGRGAWRLGGSRAVRSCGPAANVDPGGSNSGAG